MLIKGLPSDVLLRLALTRSNARRARPVHLFLCVADHYEPMVGGAAIGKQRERVDRWVKEYPKMCEGIEDSWGRPPQHTFFYPAEEYTPEPLDRLASLCHAGYGDVEVHLHHDNDTSEGLTETLREFIESLHHRHELLRRDERERISYGFIHGNWALDNSRPDGRWCGVNNELQVLIDTGCYADFTLPSAPNPTQTRTVNSIYYAQGKPGQAKGHDTGRPAAVGVASDRDSLLLVQGPLAVDWGRRKMGVLPRIENGEIHGGFPPTMSRLKQWLKAGVCVEGREDWLFIKLHTHGAVERNADILLGESAKAFHRGIMVWRDSNPDFHVYYVSAWEMAQLVHQAEQGAVTPSLPRPGQEPL